MNRVPRDVSGDPDTSGLYPQGLGVIRRVCAESLAWHMQNEADCWGYFFYENPQKVRVLAVPINDGERLATCFLANIATGCESTTWGALHELYGNPKDFLSSRGLLVHRISADEQIRLNREMITVPANLLEAYECGYIDLWLLAGRPASTVYLFDPVKERFAR